MRSLVELRTRWHTSLEYASSLEALKKSVRSDESEGPCVGGLRSVYWKIFLLFQTTDTQAWSRALGNARNVYTSLREQFLRFIDNPNELGSALDPLDDDQNSPWNTARLDEQLRAEILQDVERCMPEEPYFRLPETQRIMLDVLFIFCKINQDVGYRQGMHELLAPILWVIQQDAIDDYRETENVLSASEQVPLLEQILDPAYIEHDAFTLLSSMMRSAKSFYELGKPDKRSSVPSSGSGASSHSSSPIVERSKRIHEVYLAQFDPELAKHLTKIEVLPQVFLIRWIRLLFGREFPFDELLNLWDTLFAEDPNLELVDLVCVAMLLRIRWELIPANYSLALMLLLKYPAPKTSHGPQTFVDDAIYLRDNFSAAGGAAIIKKYSGRLPPLHLPTMRPSTPPGQALSPRQKSVRTRSPLRSPGRFLEQQGGVEALLQGAAKGVLERGERLGINQAVRDAVGEVRKNMQVLQASRTNSHNRGASDLTRWSLDEGRTIASTGATTKAMEVRNQQLARMLEHATKELRDVSSAKDTDKAGCVEAMEAVIAKVDFIRLHLEDSTIPLPQGAPETAPELSSLNLRWTPSKVAPPTQSAIARTKLITPASQQDKGSQGTNTKTTPNVIPETSIPASPGARSEAPTMRSPAASAPEVKTSKEESKPDTKGLSLRPKAPVPTRSTIAQSSFSWMLEPDTPSGSAAKSSPPKSSSPFLKSGRRPNSGPNREKAAFLFGEDGADPMASNPRLSLLADADEGFDLGTIERNSGKRREGAVDGE